MPDSGLEVQKEVVGKRVIFKVDSVGGKLILTKTKYSPTRGKGVGVKFRAIHSGVGDRQLTSVPKSNVGAKKRPVES